ncbi:MAG: hypothetical protein ACTFAK_01365 [Candidatus Electronema sp. VV]
MDATLSLHGLPNDELAELSSKLLRSLKQETDRRHGCRKSAAVLARKELKSPSARGTVVALLQVLKAYLERKPTLRFV